MIEPQTERAQQINWRSEKRKISDLVPAPYNPRKWPENETKNLAASLEKFSLADPLVINQTVMICLTCGNKFQSKKICKSRSPRYCSRQCFQESCVGRSCSEKQLYALRIGRTFPHSNKGTKWSEEAKIKASLVRIGKKLPEHHCIALSLAKKGKPIQHFILHKKEISLKISKALTGKPNFNHRGEKHHNWQGGKTSLNAKIRSSFEMKQWRKEVFLRDDYTCQICNIRGGELVADHIKPFSLYPDLRFDVANGRTICKGCDLKSDTYGGRVIIKCWEDFTKQKAEKI